MTQAFPARLRLLILKLKPFLPDHAERRAPKIAPGRLAELLQRLAGPLARARSAGADINIWSVARLDHVELRNAAVLAWFLDPAASHGLGGAVLKAVFDGLGQPARSLLQDDTFHGVSVSTEECPLGSDRDRIDISISGPTFIAFIEVKINAPLGDRQLERYLESAQSKCTAHGKSHAVVVYLSRSRSKTALPLGVLEISWKDLEVCLLSVARTLPNEAQFAGMLLRQFACHIGVF